MTWDVAIVGGGPAGSTLAALLKRHRPTTRVIVLERSRFPRFHVGETFVSEINRVLDEMGAYAKVDGAGFVRKYGATFRWGAQPEPWHMVFAALDDLRPQGERGVQTSYTWHVDRAVYDRILLDHARELGAEVRTGVAATPLVEDGRTVGVLVDGEPIPARWVVDATGQAGFAGSLADREMDPHLQNIAYWGYFRGFRLTPEYNGDLHSSRAFIVAHPTGWSWYFPIRPDLVSVGVVTTLGAHRTRGERDTHGFFTGAIRDCPELVGLLDGAELVPYEPGLPLVHRITDFSYVSRSIVQPGLLRVGDAAGFVDPILSVGCFLGQSGARYLAYALLATLRDDARFTEPELLSSYAEHVHETLGAFRQLTYFFYRFNERPDAWWAEARRLVADAGFPRRATDLHAFTAFASGFAARRGVFREPTNQFDEPFFMDAFRRLVDPEAALPAPPRLTDTDVVALVGPATRVRRAVPVEGTGTMTPALRVEVRGGAFDDASTTFVRRMLVPPSMDPLFDLLDGQRDLGTLGRDLADRIGVNDDHRPAVARYVNAVVAGLAERGLVTVRAR